MKTTFTFGSWGCGYNLGMATPSQVAHVLRRTRFSVPSGSFERYASTDIHDLVDEQLTDQGWALDVDEAASRNLDDAEWYTLPAEWMNRLMAPDAGLHERMVWFWHGHFTTNRGETNHRDMWRQHHLVRRHALGNLRDFAREIITDAAMLHFLDGASSRGDAPNENFSREFLELFMLGRNQGYTEQDVRSGARILAGWSVDWESGEISFDREHGYERPVTFLERRERWDLDSYVDAVLDQPACAEHIASALHRHLVSTPLDADRRAQLGRVLRNNDWEIRPLVSELLHSDDFVEARGHRTCQPVEWFTAATAAFGIAGMEDKGFEYWQIGQSGQIPFEPPNVAGWPDDDRWSSTSQVISRGNAMMHWELAESVIDRVEPTPDAVLAHCGIADATQTTRDAMERAIDAQTEFSHGLELLLALALLSPEFAVI